MKPVLFAGVKPLERAENLKALFDAYDGEKVHVKLDPWRRHPEIRSGKYDLMVIDEYPTESPGKCILIGHGIDGGKTGGLLMPRPYYRPEQAELITYVIATSISMCSLIARQTGVPESRVLPLGMPRTDAYQHRRKGDGGTKLADKRAYLYAPTYRSREETPLPDIDWAWLDDHLSDDEMIAVKVHTKTEKILMHGYEHIVEYEPYEQTAPYLYDCDVVITDYSTIMFDAYLLNKPVVLFEKDDGYIGTRGMYFDYPEQYCSRYCTNEKELLSMLRTADGLRQSDIGCRQLVASACDGHAAERICRLIKELA